MSASPPRPLATRDAPRPSTGVWQSAGDAVLCRIGNGFYLLGEFVSTLGRGLVPGNWRRTMRNEFYQALYQIGLRAAPAVFVVALLVAIGLVAQIIYWLGFAGQEGRIGDFLAMSLVRQIGPIMTVLIIVGRSGAVLVDEVGQLKLSGQLRVLASHGVDPIDFIVLPRTFATAVSAFLLTILFVHTALWFGHTIAAIGGLTTTTTADFYAQVFGNLGISEHLLLIVKPMISGYVVAYLSIWLGMHVEESSQGIRKALPKAFVYSLLATFLIGALITVVL